MLSVQIRRSRLVRLANFFSKPLKDGLAKKDREYHLSLIEKAVSGDPHADRELTRVWDCVHPAMKRYYILSMDLSL